MSTEAAKLNLGVQRNEDYVPHEYRLTDNNGAAIDLTGWSFTFRVNLSAGLGGAPVLALSSVPNGNGSYIKLLEASDGSFELYVAKEDIAAMAGPVDDVTALVHNLIGTDAEGYERVIARGTFYVEPGV